MGIVWHGLVLLTALWSAVRPADTLTWWLEIAPALVIYVGLMASRRSHPLTPLSHSLVACLLLIIAVGAHFGFAEVPMFDWLRLQTGGGRNDFDRLAHFFQGFAPAAVFREALTRARVAPTRRWLAVLTLALTLALSALYELVECLVSVALGERADAFIAAQGDPWDTQTDMAVALAGATVMLSLLSRIQDRQLAARGWPVVSARR